MRNEKIWTDRISFHAEGEKKFAAAPRGAEGEAWWARQDSNLRQHRYERCVLTAELQARNRGQGSGVSIQEKAMALTFLP